jgi:hypothetical protein
MLPSADPSIRAVTLACAACGRPAAKIARLPGQPSSADPLGQRERLERTVFLGRLIRYGGEAELARLFEAIKQNDFAAAREIDQDFVAFRCEACGKIYCDTCWCLHAPVFDEGFYDFTRATCPAGHEQMVDD